MALEMRIMPDYKKMYLKMLAASEEAMRVLIEAQQECEKIYIFILVKAKKTMLTNKKDGLIISPSFLFLI